MTDLSVLVARPVAQPPDGIAIPDGMPRSPCHLRALTYANALSARHFGAPVYLVGSAVWNPDPRDLDVVVVLDDELFVACYGEQADVASKWDDTALAVWRTPMWRRWARDCAKTSTKMTLFCRRAVDFKTQPRCCFDTFHEKRIRLDSGFAGG